MMFFYMYIYSVIFYIARELTERIGATTRQSRELKSLFLHFPYFWKSMDI